MPLVAAPAPMIFDYKDPKGISAVSLAIDSPLEPIVGWAKGISGSLTFDPAHPERTKGAVTVDVDSVTFANDGYTATARGYALNGKKWPQLKLVIRKVVSVKRTTPTHYEGVVLADFTCRGITQAKRLNVTADYFAGKAEERTNGQHKGDLLVLRTKFGVSRKAHGISDGIPDSMVGDRIEVGVAVVGIHYAPVAAAKPKAPAVPLRVMRRYEPSAADLPLPRLGGGAPASLTGLRKGTPLVVFFLNEQCGVTVFYKERLRRLVRDFEAKGFRFVAVRTGRKQTPGQPVELPEQGYLRMPFLDDVDGALMREFGVEQSLTFAVLDRGGRTRYFGGFDDNVNESRVKRTPLRDALREMAAGKPVRVARSASVGCAILPVAR